MADAVPLRIMPLGASITWGQGSSDGDGYRGVLRNQLTGAGNVVNMVGSRRSGAMRDNDVEGWSGYRIEQVHEKAKQSVPQSKPNVILVNAGTNDAGQNFNVGTAGQRMEAMLNDLWGMSPRATIVLSTLLVNKSPTTEQNVQNINGQYRALVSSLRGAGRRIVLAEMHADNGPTTGDLLDDTHPGDTGYRKMANIWYASMIQARDLGFLQAPEPVAGVPNDGNDRA